MLKAIRITILALAFSISWPALACEGISTGQCFLQNCERESSWSATCVGFVAGSYKMISHLHTLGALSPNAAATWCVPGDVTVGQAMAALIGYLKNRPNERHQDSAQLVYLSLLDALRMLPLKSWDLLSKAERLPTFLSLTLIFLRMLRPGGSFLVTLLRRSEGTPHSINFFKSCSFDRRNRQRTRTP